jgi:hypothetical protein
MADPVLSELERYEALTRFPEDTAPSKVKTQSISKSLDVLLNQLYEMKRAAEASELPPSALQELPILVDAQKKEIDERQKEIHVSWTKLGKAVDKVSSDSLL